jgi:hypothetical protein
MSTTAKFYFLLTYFKASGKYYSAGVAEWECRTIDANPSQAYYHDIIAKVRGYRDHERQMPGLIGAWTDGPILIEQAKPIVANPNINATDDFVGDGVPHILIPDKEIEHRGGELVVSGAERLHGKFGLSYASYLTVPRSALQSMPDEWQGKMATLLDELDKAVDDHGIVWPPRGLKVRVELVDVEDDRDVNHEDDLANYQRGRRRLW